MPSNDSLWNSAIIVSMNKNIYPFKKIQEKWKKYVIPKNKDAPNFYVAAMWPYPSGELHMGHVRNYTIADIMARLKHLQGYNVFQPMGWDAHGLPAENAAKEHNMHPRTWTENNIATMKEQLQSLFFAYDWAYEMSTCDEVYYKFQQKLFIEMFKAGFVKRKEEYVNWDSVDKTVLANEQVINGKGWRSGAPVERKLLSQWFFTISDFSEILLKDLDKLEGKWPSQIITMQRNWIGKNVGYAIKFGHMEVFTKSPYFIDKVEFLAVAPDSTYGIELYKKYEVVREFITHNSRTTDKKDMRGIFTGEYTYNPYNNQKIPIYIGNYVLGDYGTGVVMGVPSISESDYNFATQNHIKIVHAMAIEDYMEREPNDRELALQKDLLIKNIAREKTVYKMKDWCISRQRFWGTPIPIIYCERCGALPNEDLPVKSCEHEDLNTICPKCRGKALKEKDTMDTFVDSSWYSWRFPCSQNSEEIFDENLKKFPFVNIYVGGPEHAVLHLLFARFFGKMLNILGYIEDSEPFHTFYPQGMICMQTYKNKVTNTFVNPKNVVEEDGLLYTTNNGIKQEVIRGNFEKMSKSKKNTVSPTELLKVYGADALRLSIVSDTPANKDLQWNEKNLNGCWCFNNRLWTITHNLISHNTTNDSRDSFFTNYSLNIFHNIIEELQALNINVAIAQIRIFVNYVEENKNFISKDLLVEKWKDLLKLYWCICPIISMECLEILGDNLEFKLPLSKAKCESHIYELVIQRNGRKLSTMEVKDTLTEQEIIQLVINTYDNLKHHRKVIFIKYKVINFVI